MFAFDPDNNVVKEYSYKGSTLTTNTNDHQASAILARDLPIENKTNQLKITRKLLQGYSFITSVSIRLFPGDGDDILSVLQAEISPNFSLHCKQQWTTKLSGWFVDVTLLFWSRE